MPEIENTSRERILARIRSALAGQEASAQSLQVKSVFPPVNNLLDRFKEECVANVTECFVTSNMAATAHEVEKNLTSIASSNIFVQECSELRQMASHFAKLHPIQWSSEGPPTAFTDATITTCEALVAQTGSVVVSAARGGRAASIIAPVHIVVAKTDQLVPDLDSALAQLQSRGVSAANSFLCVITGSSRTADIEKILVMGAHGPRRLLVFLSPP